MQISKETLQILKNFSGINSNILIKPGNRLATISPQKNVMAEVTVPETFPVEFGIYDLSELLGAVSLFDTPEIEFSSNKATISQGDKDIDYFASDVSVLTVPPEKKITFPTAVVEFDLPGTELTQIIRTASVLKATDLSVVGDGSSLRIVVSDLKNATSHKFNMHIGETDLTFRANIKIDNLKMIHQDYKVSIASKGITRWVDSADNMTVFVALEANSQF
jgi:hypothetical protein